MGRWPELSAAALLKEASEDFYPETDEYGAFTAENASALCHWFGTDPRIRTDKITAHQRCWQLRLTAEDPTEDDETRERLRILVLNGATTMFSLTKYIAEMFECREVGKPYSPQPSKGTVPQGSHWTVERIVGGDHAEQPEPILAAGIIGTPKSVYKAAGNGAPFFHEKKVKVYQVFRKRGDVLLYRCDDREVTVRMDGVELKPQRFGHSAFNSPKLVGGDSQSLPKQTWTDLNSLYLTKRKEESYIVAGSLTKEQMEDATANTFKVPLFDNRGNPFPPGNAGFDALAEMHRLVALPFMD